MTSHPSGGCTACLSPEKSIAPFDWQKAVAVAKECLWGRIRGRISKIRVQHWELKFSEWESGTFPSKRYCYNWRPDKAVDRFTLILQVEIASAPSPPTCARPTDSGYTSYVRRVRALFVGLGSTKKGFSWRPDLNRRSFDYKSNALPLGHTSLQSLKGKIRITISNSDHLLIFGK